MKYLVRCWPWVSWVWITVIFLLAVKSSRCGYEAEMEEEVELIWKG
jgi:hypothetical protein